jgi:hypothetical protein
MDDATRARNALNGRYCGSCAHYKPDTKSCWNNQNPPDIFYHCYMWKDLKQGRVLSQEEVDQLLGAISSGNIDQVLPSNNLTQEDIDNLLKGSK